MALPARVHEEVVAPSAAVGRDPWYRFSEWVYVRYEKYGAHVAFALMALLVGVFMGLALITPDTYSR